LNYFIYSPNVTGIIERYLVEIRSSIYGKIIDGFSTLPFLPIVGNLFDLIFFVVPDKHPRVDFGTYKESQNLDTLV